MTQAKSFIKIWKNFMYDLQQLYDIPPFSLAKKDKQALFTDELKKLTLHHMEHCTQYKNMMKGIGFSEQQVKSAADIPFLPVSLFKDLDLKSISDEEVFKTLTSSGTTGQRVSKIFLDKNAASLQQKTLVKIVSSFTNASRLPMLIIDSPSVIKDRTMFSARGAGILGFSIFGADRTFALNDEMEIDFAGIEKFLEKHTGKPILLFGFTFMIWQHFYKELVKADKFIDLSQGILIHGGGWKKLISEAVSAEDFQQKLESVCGLKSVHDYYGMVEQTGCIYMQCEQGHLHASNFSDIFIRNPFDFSLCKSGETGIIQVVSLLPHSYPGHSLLTEDEGILLGEDDCPCGRKGKYFKVLGRIKNAEIRGCSDTYASQF